MTPAILAPSAALFLIAAVWFTIRRVRERRDALMHLLAQRSSALEDLQRFSMVLVHEIRAPLAVLRADIERSLATAPSPAEHRAQAAAHLIDIDRLTSMISRLLTLARADTGEIAIRRELVDLGAHGAAVVEALAPVATTKGLELTYSCRKAAHVIGDPGWLKQLVVNLVDNAIKFTPAGGVVVVAITRDVDAVTLSVCDSGVGIPSDAIDRIFDRFYRAGSLHAEGFGLGLSLVKWITDQHCGSIGVDSQVGRGTAFTVKLPRSGGSNKHPFMRGSRGLHVSAVQ